MNIFFWTLQILLAAHTAIGAVWKFSHSAEQTMPSLKAIPQSVWLGLSGLEFLCVAALILPLFRKSLGKLPPLAAIVIAGEMGLFCIVHLASGSRDSGPLVYWLVVAALCALLAYGRFALRPIGRVGLAG